MPDDRKFPFRPDSYGLPPDALATEDIEKAYGVPPGTVHPGTSTPALLSVSDERFFRKVAAHTYVYDPLCEVCGRRATERVIAGKQFDCHGCASMFRTPDGVEHWRCREHPWRGTYITEELLGDAVISQPVLNE